MGVVWGEGGGPASQCGPVIGAGLAVWVQRLIHLMWRRLTVNSREM